MKVVTKTPASVESKLAASRMEGASSRWGAHSLAKSASMVEDGVSKALMVVSIVVAYDPKQKVFYR